MISLLFHYPITQSNQGYSCDDTGCNIADKATYIPLLKHLHAFVGKGGESGKSTAQTSGEQQAPRIGKGTVFAEQSVQNSNHQTTEQVDEQCSPRKALMAYLFHQCGDAIPQGSTDKTADAHYQE